MEKIEKKSKDINREEILTLLELDQKTKWSVKMDSYYILKESAFLKNVDTTYIDNFILDKNLIYKNWKIYFDVKIWNTNFTSNMEFLDKWGKSNKVVFNILWETYDFEFDNMIDFIKFVKITEKILNIAIKNNKELKYEENKLTAPWIILDETVYLSDKNFDFLKDKEKEKYSIFLNSIIKKIKEDKTLKNKIIKIDWIENSFLAYSVYEYKKLKRWLASIKSKSLKSIYEFYKNNNLNSEIDFNKNLYLQIYLLETLHKEWIKDRVSDINLFLSSIFENPINIYFFEKELLKFNAEKILIRIKFHKKTNKNVIFKIEWLENNRNQIIWEIKVPIEYYKMLVLWH